MRRQRNRRPRHYMRSRREARFADRLERLVASLSTLANLTIHLHADFSAINDALERGRAAFAQMRERYGVPNVATPSRTTED